MKHTKRNSLIILLITILVLVFILKDDYENIMNVLREVKIPWLLLTIVLYFVYFLLDQLSLHTIITQYKKDFKFGYSLYLGIITKFFNGITPLAAGGQPMEVYEMRKKGVSVANGTNIVIQNYIVFQIALVLWALVAITLNKTLHLFAYVPFLKQFSVIGFIINFVILALLFLISFSKTFNKTIVVGIIKALAKVNIIKNKDELIKKWEKLCDDYYQNAKIMLDNKWEFFKCIFYQIISLGIFYALPFFMAISLNISDVTLIGALAASSYVYVMGCYVPIPGASGGMEAAFLGFFNNFVTDSPLKALLILWRFMTYYVPTIIGAIIFNIFSDYKEENKSN